MAAVLDAAVGLVGRQAGLSVQALSRESGVSTGSIYHHFGSLEGVRAACWTRCIVALLETLVAAVLPAQTPEAGVTALVEAYLGWTQASSAEARVIHFAAEQGFSPTQQARIQAAKAPHLAALGGWLAGHVAAGRVVPLSPQLAELVLIGPLAEIARRWLAGADIDLPQITASLPARLWAAIRAD